MKELASLQIGTVIQYTAGGYETGITTEYIVLDSFVNDWGHWVNLLDKEDNHISPYQATTSVYESQEIGKFSIVKEQQAV